MTDVHDITASMLQAARLKKYDHPKMEEFLEDSEVIRDAAQAILDREPWDALDNLVEALAELEPLSDLLIAIHPDRVDLIRTSIDEIIDLFPRQEDMQQVVDLWDGLNESIDEVTGHREAPRDYEADEKEQARNDVKEKLAEFAGWLDAISIKRKEGE